jgi:hypothetical protein
MSVTLKSTAILAVGVLGYRRVRPRGEERKPKEPPFCSSRAAAFFFAPRGINRRLPESLP